jgi:hypothetical protein
VWKAVILYASMQSHAQMVLLFGRRRVFDFRAGQLILDQLLPWRASALPWLFSDPIDYFGHPARINATESTRSDI